MTTLTFDNHLFIKNLIKSGINVEQAEAIADGLKESRELDLSQLVTKDYLKAEVAEIRKDMSRMELRLIFWILGVGIAGFASMTGILVGVLQFYLTQKGVPL